MIAQQTLRWFGLGIACVCSLAANNIYAAEGRSEKLHHLTDHLLDERAESDANLLRSYSCAMQALLSELEKHSAIWNRDAKTPLTPDERRLTFALFEQTMSYVIALDGMSQFHADFWRLNAVTDGLRHARHFALGFAAYCMKIRLGLAFTDLTLNKPQFEKLLDEGSRQHGVPPGVYARLKWNIVHVEMLSRVFAMHQYHKILLKTAYPRLGKDRGSPPILDMLDGSYAAIKNRLVKRGATLFAGNALDILKDGGHDAWFPVQTRAAEFLGDTKVHRLDSMLISAEQVDDTTTKSLPGDIIVERRNWYLSNVALPGFWPHAALWLGNPSEMERFLDGDAEVRVAYDGAFTAALKKSYPQQWATYIAPDAEGHPHRIVEAMSEGVVFTSAEHSVRADYAAALRPRLSKLEVARAIERAFHFVGRPYDFDFDFFTDKALVCSELIYKSYEPRKGVVGLRLPLERIAGRMTLGPNTMVRMFDEQFGTPEQQLDFVWFLDGREGMQNAFWSDLEGFRASHQRFKWDIAQK